MMKRLSIAVGISLGVIFLQSGCAAAPAVTEAAPTETPPSIDVHFLGHAAFILEFDDGLTVLSDYGDASQTGWAVRVFEFGSFRPDIVTYSQTHHRDHFLPMEFANAKILIGDAELSGEDLAVTPVPTHELTMDSFDSCGYLFAYKGLKLLNAGEPLQYILAADRADVRNEIREKYADAYDLVILPVSGLNITFPQLESFIGLLNAKRVLLMHGMSLSTYTGFLAFLADEHPGEYLPVERKGPSYRLEGSADESRPAVISLVPAAYEPAP